MSARRASATSAVLAALDAAGHEPRPSGPACWQSACPACTASTLTVREVEWNDGRPRARLDCAAGCQEHAILAVLGLAERDLHASNRLIPDEQDRRGRLSVRRASEITACEVAWLWDQRLPLGKLCVLAGPAGQGKSLFTADLAARVSRGELDGHLLGQPAAVVLITGEDDPEDTIKPRLVAAGADVDRVLLVDLAGPDGSRLPLTLPRDAEQLAQTIADYAVRLVIVDPIVSFLDDAYDAYKNQKVRRALAPLHAAAQRLGCVVLLVLHPNKTQTNDPAVRIGESYAFQALSRSVLVLGPDPRDPDGERGSRKALAVAKSNLAISGSHALGFQIEPVEIDTDGGTITTQRVMLTGPRDDLQARDLLGPPSDGSRLEAAADWLAAELDDGPKPAREITRAARAAGYSTATLRRAKRSLGIHSERIGGIAEDGAWQWALPDDDGDELHALEQAITNAMRPTNGHHTAGAAS
jgi:putative DNA primase/helicase